MTVTETADGARPIPHEPRGLAPGLFRLDGRKAVISGGSKNIGLEIAAAFAQAGASLMLVGRKAEQLDHAREGLTKLAPEASVHTVAADISSSEGAGLIADSVSEAFGTADIVVNNAHFTGSTRGVPFTEITDEQWHEPFETNLFGPVRLLNKLLAPVIASGGNASVINVLSGSAWKPTPDLPVYCTSKAALWMLTRYMSEALGPNIRVNAVCPGIVTEYGVPRFAYGSSLLENGGIPLRRVGLPEEVSAAALYLASDASSYSTGAVIHCNGGRPWA